MAQRSGQSIQIQYGVVVGSKYIKEQSAAETDEAMDRAFRKISILCDT